jgi:hypothetical protein
MGFATHLGPWLLGTVKNTTGTTAGTVRNTGCTVVAQSGVTTVADTTATTEFWIPAGSQILELFTLTLLQHTLVRLATLSLSVQEARFWVLSVALLLLLWQLVVKHLLLLAQTLLLL